MNLVMRCKAERKLSKAMNISLKTASNVLDALKEEVELLQVKEMLSRLAMNKENQR